MDANDIKTAWDELSPNEAFEYFASIGASVDDVEKALNSDVADGYSQWIYFQLK